MEDIADTCFVVVVRDKDQWGRGPNLRSASRDAGWKGDLNRFPEGGIEVWLNTQRPSDICTESGIKAGLYSAWDEPGNQGRGEPVTAGTFAPPLLAEDGESIIHRGELLRVW